MSYLYQRWKRKHFPDLFKDEHYDARVLGKFKEPEPMDQQQLASANKETLREHISDLTRQIDVVKAGAAREAEAHSETHRMLDKHRNALNIVRDAVRNGRAIDAVVDLGGQFAVAIGRTPQVAREDVIRLKAQFEGATTAVAALSDVIDSLRIEYNIDKKKLSDMVVKNITRRALEATLRELFGSTEMFGVETSRPSAPRI